MNNHSNKASSSSSATRTSNNTNNTHTTTVHTALANGNSSTSNNLAKQLQRYCAVDPTTYFPGDTPKEMPPEKPPLALEIYPPFAEFIEFGGASKHTLTNTGGSRMVFKIKCSNNAIFKVAPVYAFLDPGASTELQILRQESPSKRDKLVFMFKEAKRIDKDPKKAFFIEGQTSKAVLPLITRDVEVVLMDTTPRSPHLPSS